MANYVFTNSMKRYERSSLCVKLHNELMQNGQHIRTLTQLQKNIELKLKGQNKFRPKQEPIFAITLQTYKGVPIYYFMDKTTRFDFIVNTSPVDAAYVEFIRVVNRPDVATVVYTQHLLDRYNERMHRDKYTNHKDMMKRLIINNPPMGDATTDDHTNKTVVRAHEGFMCGTYDPVHLCLILNTFFDHEEYRDNKNQLLARNTFHKMSELTPKQTLQYNILRDNLVEGLISKEEFDYLLWLFRLEGAKST